MQIYLKSDTDFHGVKKNRAKRGMEPRFSFFSIKKYICIQKLYTFAFGKCFTQIAKIA